MHEIIQRDYAYSDGKLLEQWYREVNTQIRSIIEHINNTPQAVDWTPQLQQIVARLTTLESVSPSDFSAEIQQIVARLDAIESANVQTQTDLSQIRTDIAEIQNMLASIVGMPVSPPATPPVAEFSGTVSLTSGIATFGQVIPEGQIPSGSYVKVGSLTTQNDIKTTWDDGSIRFVVLTCEPSSDGDYTLSRDNTSQASAMTPPAIPSNTYVELDIGGSVYRATCPTTHSSDKWLEGSLCVESRFEVIPILVSDGTTEHGFLRVIFDVRSHSVSAYRIDVTVENCLDKSGADVTTYDVDVVVAGENVLSKAAVAHYYLTRWRKTFSAGFTTASITPDFQPFIDANAIPKYWSSITNTVASPTGSNFDILKAGSLVWDMPAPGGRPEIAPYPDWAARYLAHKNLTQRSYVLAHGDLAGSYPVHVRKIGVGGFNGVGPNGYVSIDEQPNYWLDGRSDHPDRPAGRFGDSPLIPDNAHVPSLAYIPYLLTGDRYYADEMAHWANYVIIVTWPAGGREGIKGLLVANQERGIAWGLRNMVDAASYLPDNEPMKAYLIEKINYNLEWLDEYALAHQAPVGSYFERYAPDIHASQIYISGVWQLNYIAWTLDRAIKHGFQGGKQLRDNLVGFVLSLWNSPDWPNNVLGSGTIYVGQVVDNVWNYYPTIAEVYNQTYVQRQSTIFPLSYYGVDYRLAFMIGIEQGFLGSESAYDYVHNAIAVESSDLQGRSGWGIEVL